MTSVCLGLGHLPYKNVKVGQPRVFVWLVSREWGTSRLSPGLHDDMFPVGSIVSHPFRKKRGKDGAPYGSWVDQKGQGQRTGVSALHQLDFVTASV